VSDPGWDIPELRAAAPPRPPTSPRLPARTRLRAPALLLVLARLGGERRVRARGPPVRERIGDDRLVSGRVP
jgi:hypothetical protein